MGERRWPLALGVGALVIVAACGPGQATPDTSPIIVGAVYPTGTSASTDSDDELDGVKLAAELVNADGGVNHRKISLSVEQAAGPDAARQAVDTLRGRGASVFIGTFDSSLSLAASARASAAGATYLEAGALADEVTARGLPGVLRTSTRGGVLGAQGVEFAHDVVLPALGVAVTGARAVVVFSDDPFAASAGYGVVQAAAANGLTIVDTIRYPAGGASFDAIASQLAADRADIVFSAGYQEHVVALRKAMIARKVKVKAIIGGGSGYTTAGYGRALATGAVGVFGAGKPDQDVNEAGLSPDARALLKRAGTRYQQLHNNPMSGNAMSGFVGGWVLFHEVLTHAGSTSRADVMKAAMSLDLPKGAEINGGGVKFAGPQEANAGQNLRASSVIVEWLAPGQRTVVYPPALARAQAQVKTLS
jgi:branched-chain amino acid transport system substrate-binding protein